MNHRFERTGPLTELSSYPQWAQDMAGACEEARRSVIGHELWVLMCEARLDRQGTRDFMVGIWPLIERFPAYMARNLLKARYGRSAGDDLARRWLARSIRVGQNHADHWLDWAEGAGVPRWEVLYGERAQGTQVLADWCEEVSQYDSLAAGIAVTNYAVEGATGAWAGLLYGNAGYARSLRADKRARGLRWLQLHAAHGDTHPWEALEIVCTLKGTAPAADEVDHLTECVRRSYVGMRVLADLCLGRARVYGTVNEEAA